MHGLRPPGGNSIRHPTSDRLQIPHKQNGHSSSIKPPMNQHIDMFSTQARSLPNPRGPWTRARQTPSTVQNSKQLEVPIPSSPFSLFPLPLSVQSFVRVCFLFLVTWSGGSRIPLQVSETLLSPRRAHASTARPSSLNIPISCLLYTSPSPRD